MAISVSFTTSQVLGAPQNIVITDTSSGSDVTAANRRVIITNAAGQYITESGLSTTATYTTWPLLDGPLTLDILSTDAALLITLNYVNVSGATVATGNSLNGFTLYNETYYYSLTQAQAQQKQPPPMIIQDSNYYYNKMILRENIDDGNQAISLGNDITTAQNAYDRATYMVLNENDYF